VITVYFDTETGGLTYNHPTIQIAAIAVDENWREVDAFERKLQFDITRADPQALKMNSYAKHVWDREAIPEDQALNDFSAFLKQYAVIEMRSRVTGNPYRVARLAGYNAASFDGPRLKHHYESNGMFLPAHPQVLCVLQRAQWWYAENPQIQKPANLKLGTVCEAFGIEVAGAHDALADVRMTVALAKVLATPVANGVAA
jgi:DNA polymerase III epsilon subunit-like protein